MRSPAVSTLALVAVALTALPAIVMRERELHTPRDLHAVAYTGAASCTRCHADHAASFGRTFHRTMTQVARGEAIRAPFGGETVRYFGVPARMDKRANGTPTMVFGGGRVPERSFDIALTVGSRRYQQYIGRVGDTLFRLPWAYHLEEKRWFHMNGAFLTADPELSGSGISDADYTRHMTRWNDNCIFCHNVRPSPGLLGTRRGEPFFASSVEEYGVACEACHGPGAEHAQHNRDPYRRYRLHTSTLADPSIVNPARLTAERSLDVCGRCHGQRITDDVSQFLRHGDRFVPGDDLANYSAPLWRDTPLDGEIGGFAPRFWADGTPRLTAYEYQGTLLSACATRGTMTCLSCHDMHAGDPRGQLRPALSGDSLCTQCHSTLASSDGRTKHTQHADVRCVDCHMPKLVYGVMASHPSHRVELPAVRAQAGLGRPDACTLCHVDRSRAWAIENRERMWTGAKTAPSVAENAAFSQAELQLLAADPVTRAITAARYGEDSVGALPARVNALLLDVMEHDNYPGVRHLAYRSLIARSYANAGVYEPEATADVRRRAVEALRKTLPVATLDAQAIADLRAQARDEAIDIGE